MKLTKFFISYINYLVFISCLEVQLNVHESNGTIYNYTIINGTDSKNELFEAQKIFENNCQCNYNTDVFYVSPSKNTINFTINTTEITPNLSSKKMEVEDPKLFINSQNIGAEYTLIKNENENIYNLQISAVCKKEENNLMNNNNLNNNDDNKKVIKDYGIYKIESFSRNNHPEYNDNDYFSVLNFTFYYNKTLYDFSFLKICFSDENYKHIISCCCVMLIAFIYVYLSTYMKLNFKFVKEVQQASDIEWYHICFAVVFGSGLLVSIYLFRKYILIILNILIGFESWLCTYYTTLFFVIRIGRNIFLNSKHIQLTKKKYEFFLGLNFYEISSLFISGLLILFYFLTRHWIINDIICFGLAFTTLSFIVLKSFMLCFVCLFAFFVYDTFWVFYSEKIFTENVMVVAATSIQIPIKIEFPILFSNNPIKNCMLLGLGDILLPGMVIKYCRRFDILKKKMDKKKVGFRKKKSKIGFYLFNLILYFISVTLAMLAMFVFNHGQPVLFYISPIFIIGLMGKAYYEGCFGIFWNGIKIKKKQKKEKTKTEEEEGDEENEEEEDDEEENNNKYYDKKGKKFFDNKKKYELNELQQLNLNN